MKKCISLLLAAAFCTIIPGCTNQTTPDPPTSFDGTPSSSYTTQTPSSSSNTSQTPSSSSMPKSGSESISSPSDTSKPFEENEELEALIKKTYEHDRYPYFACDVPEGYYVSFEEGKEVHIPLPNLGTGPGYTEAHAISLRKDALVVAYYEGKPNHISVLSTTDQGKIWQTSEFYAENAKRMYMYYMTFRSAENGVLINPNNNHEIFITEDTGKTWRQAGFLPENVILVTFKTIGDTYWIAGEKDNLPMVLKSDNGADWKEIQIPLDTTEYTGGGYCSDVHIFDDGMGLAYVVARNTKDEIVHMWFSSEDRGETWSLYKIEKTFP